MKREQADYDIMKARMLAKARGATPAEVQANVNKLTSDDPNDCHGRTFREALDSMHGKYHPVNQHTAIDLQQFHVPCEIPRRTPNSPLMQCEFHTLLRIRAFNAEEADYARMVMLVQTWARVRIFERQSPTTWLPRKARAIRIHASSGGFNP